MYTEISSSFLITCELSRSTSILKRAQNLVWQVVTWRPSKIVKIGGWAIVRGWVLAQDNTVSVCMCNYIYVGNTHFRFLLQYLTTVHHFQDYFLVYIMYRYMTKTCDLGFKVSWSMDYFLTHSSPYKMCYQLHMQVGMVVSNCWTGLLDWITGLTFELKMRVYQTSTQSDVQNWVTCSTMLFGK